MTTKKVLRLVSVCLISGLMLIFINVALAESPLAKNRASGYDGQSRFNRWAGSIPDKYPLLEDGPSTGITITHSEPTYTNFRIYFTATIAGGSPPIYYKWSFGDGAVSSLDPQPVASHPYTSTGTYAVIVTAIDSDLNIVSGSTSITVENAPYSIYLPQVWRDFALPVEPSDLACDLSIDPPDPSPDETFVINVNLKNLQGGSADGFWVDLYINPSKLPNKNDLFPWPDACTSPDCPGGIAWRISENELRAGITRTHLSVPNNYHPNGFDPDYSIWTGSLKAGTYKLYAYADSIDNPALEDVYGAVPETNEDNNSCELNLVIPANNARIDQTPSNALPVRSRP